ncbi:hypothetical protein H920_13605 [Fukomys damarensis]|uniref:Uncharacterized protein n=1 Tax=Fukomys damarensis TaxID=885580 RepID=A0A091CYY3_FUKDA|nr:hypothetical protein H920_13605 [Fukomys damarensis]
MAAVRMLLGLLAVALLGLSSAHNLEEGEDQEEKGEQGHRKGEQGDQVENQLGRSVQVVISSTPPGEVGFLSSLDTASEIIIPVPSDWKADEYREHQACQ